MHEAVEDPPVPYTPPGQAVHAATLLAVEYVPTAQAVQVDAPVETPVLVLEPAAHAVHDTTLLAVEYVPAAQAVHEDAPVVLAEPVYEPALHAPHVYPGQVRHVATVAPPVE